MFIGFIYNKYKKTIDIEEQYSDGELIQKYLLNDSSLTKNNKPILWIHIEFDKNARSWESFGSRTSDNLNQPYQYLTIRNIIDHCGESFNVCLIDDDSFINIIPEWRTRVEHLPRPLRSHIRDLALATILHIYGGFLLPSSFICFETFALRALTGFSFVIANRTFFVWILSSSMCLNTFFFNGSKFKAICFYTLASINAYNSD
jgi:hypothetical protein